MEKPLLDREREPGTVSRQLAALCVHDFLTPLGACVPLLVAFPAR